MKKYTLFSTLILASMVSIPTVAADLSGAVGLGLNTGVSVASDDGETTMSSGESTDGFTLFGRFGLSKKWGIVASYRKLDGEDAEEYTQIGVHGVITWRSDRRVRPHFKFGLVHTEMEVPGVSPLSTDAGVGPSIGGGVEIGSQRIAFIGELDSTGVQLGDETRGIANWTAGMVVRF